MIKVNVTINKTNWNCAPPTGGSEKTITSVILLPSPSSKKNLKHYLNLIMRKHQTNQVETHSTKHLSPVTIYGVNILNVKKRLRNSPAVKTRETWQLNGIHDSGLGETQMVPADYWVIMYQCYLLFFMVALLLCRRMSMWGKSLIRISLGAG